MTRGTGIYDDDAGSAADERNKASTKADGDVSRKNVPEDTPDVDESAQEPPD